MSDQKETQAENIPKERYSRLGSMAFWLFHQQQRPPGHIGRFLPRTLLRLPELLRESEVQHATVCDRHTRVREEGGSWSRYSRSALADRGSSNGLTRGHLVERMSTRVSGDSRIMKVLSVALKSQLNRCFRTHTRCEHMFNAPRKSNKNPTCEWSLARTFEPPEPRNPTNPTDAESNKSNARPEYPDGEG